MHHRVLVFGVGVASAALVGVLALARRASSDAVLELRLEQADLAQQDPAQPHGAAAAGVLDKDPKPFDQPDLALEFFLRQRLAAGQTDLPLDHLHRVRGALEERELALAGSGDSSPRPGGVTQWASIGPGNIGGRTRAIVIDPTNTDALYAAGVAGGVWKSVDRGAHWFAMDDHMENLAVCSLAMDPADSNVIYAGTGEGFGSSAFVRGLGIFKTTDAGGTWTQLASTVAPAMGSAFHWVNKVVVSPNDSQRVYAGTRYGVYRSLDGGQSWSVVLANPTYTSAGYSTNGCTVGCTDLAVRSDSNPDVLFAAFGSFQADGLYRSDDGGGSWVEYTTASCQGRMSIAIAPSDNDRIYLTMADNGGLSGFGRIVSIFRSDDGASFSAVLDPTHKFSPWLMSYSSIATGCVQAPTIYSQGWYDNIIAVDPVDPDVVWVGGIDLFRSDDAGQTFGMASYWFDYMSNPPPPTYVHPDQHALVFDPGYDGAANQTLYVGNDGGLFRTGNARAATTQEECPIAANPGPPPDITWESLNNGYGVTQYYHGDVARDADTFVGGSQDNGTSQVLARNTPEDWRMIFGGDGGYVAIDPLNDQRMFIEIQFFPEIRRSLDGGQTFELAVNGITDKDGLFITPFAMDRSDPDVLWTGGSRPWRTTDGADNWMLVGPDFAAAGTISAIGIAPSDSNVVYLGFNNGYVARSTNALDPSPSWQVFTTGLYGGWVSSMAVHPSDPGVACITYSTYGIPHVLRTSNGGQSWTRIDGAGASGIPDIPAHWVALRPCQPEQMYVGTELGLFASDDNGATWQPANVGLPHTVVESLTFQDDDTLVAYTHGRGAFVVDLDPCCTLASYCTAKPSSIPGCVPAISSTGVPSASAGSGFVVAAAPLPGKKPGLFIYTTDGPAQTPTQNAFGHLCLSGGIFRLPVQSSGGSASSCSGQLTVDFNAYFATQTQNPALVAGARVDLQAWYRDPANSGGANLTDAGYFYMCP